MLLGAMKKLKYIFNNFSNTCSTKRLIWRIKVNCHHLFGKKKMKMEKKILGADFKGLKAIMYFFLTILQDIFAGTYMN